MPGTEPEPLPATTSLRTRSTERLDELDDPVGESLDGVARLAGGRADPDVVEDDHVVVGGQVVDEFGVPPVDGSAQAVHQHQGDTAQRTHPTVGEPSGRTVDEQVLSCVGQIRLHRVFPD